MGRTDKLFEEVLLNARKDREKLEKIRDNLTNMSPDQVAIVEETPLAMLGVAENVVKIHDVLVKVNGQLVELAKIAAKMENPESDLTPDSDDIYDELEQDPRQQVS